MTARFGTAPQYLKIAGSRQYHAMFQLLSPHPDEAPLPR
jgi:hypothetical protein